MIYCDVEGKGIIPLVLRHQSLLVLLNKEIEANVTFRLTFSQQLKANFLNVVAHDSH